VSEQSTTGFLPSEHGFVFSNSWPDGPAVSVPLGIGSLGVGNAGRGLCGGMVFAALDYWRAGAQPPAARPAAGTPLFRFIVRRLVHSWRVPAGVGRYYRWMLLADGEVARRTTRRHWPAVKAMLDAGVPAAVGVVTVASAYPLLLGGNHQVLAYGYETDGSLVTLHVYDPNVGPDDTVVIRWDSGAEPPSFGHNLGLRLPVRGFFLTRYRPARPPGVRTRPPRATRAAGTPSC
jgi:hypothetical protein